MTTIGKSDDSLERINSIVAFILMGDLRKIPLNIFFGSCTLKISEDISGKGNRKTQQKVYGFLKDLHKQFEQDQVRHVVCYGGRNEISSIVILLSKEFKKELNKEQLEEKAWFESRERFQKRSKKIFN